MNDKLYMAWQYLGALAMILYYAHPVPVTAAVILTPNITEIEEKVAQNQSMSELDIVLRVSRSIVTNHTYQYGVFDCTQFSEELVSELSQLNISAECVAGYIYNPEIHYRKYLHTWVEVNLSEGWFPVEATSGEIIDVDEYNNYFTVIRKGLCW